MVKRYEFLDKLANINSIDNINIESKKIIEYVDKKLLNDVDIKKFINKIHITHIENNNAIVTKSIHSNRLVINNSNGRDYAYDSTGEKIIPSGDDGLYAIWSDDITDSTDVLQNTDPWYYKTSNIDSYDITFDIVLEPGMSVNAAFYAKLYYLGIDPRSVDDNGDYIYADIETLSDNDKNTFGYWAYTPTKASGDEDPDINANLGNIIIEYDSDNDIITMKFKVS